MLEIFVLIMLLCLFAAGVFSPVTASVPHSSKPNSPEKASANPTADGAIKNIPEESVSFLSFLRNQIEAELFPRPTCSILQRHYDALVTAELENRLALMTQ